MKDLAKSAGRVHSVGLSALGAAGQRPRLTGGHEKTCVKQLIANLILLGASGYHYPMGLQCVNPALPMHIVLPVTLLLLSHTGQ